jgi:dTDP-4-amino-4,6-dideoxygalactose transaminase
LSAPSIPVFDVRVEPGDIEAVEGALAAPLGGRERVERFEARFAEHLGCEHAVAVSSCTAALHIACVAAGVGPGDEVIVPSLTFVATAAAVRYTGATPIFCDLESAGTLQIDPEAVDAAITPATKAVLIVHFAGYPAAVDRIAEVCERRGVTLIEDAAHVPVASLDGRAPGTFGAAGCFSFFSNKVLACGEGGALVTDDAEVAELARWMRGDRDAAGAGRGPALNYRLDEGRAALLGSRFDRLAAEIDQRRGLVRRYFDLLDDVEGVEVPFRDADVDGSSGYLMTVLVDPERRREVRAALLERGIQTTIFPAVHELSAYRDLAPDLSLPITERVARSHIVLPLFPHLSDEEQERVVAALAEEVAA